MSDSAHLGGKLLGLLPTYVHFHIAGFTVCDRGGQKSGYLITSSCLHSIYLVLGAELSSVGPVRTLHHLRDLGLCGGKTRVGRES